MPQCTGQSVPAAGLKSDLANPCTLPLASHEATGGNLARESVDSESASDPSQPLPKIDR